MYMVGPLAVLPVSPAVSTTEVENDIVGGPWLSYWRVQQRPPSSLKRTSMAGHLGALPAGPAASTNEFEDNDDGGPPGGRCQRVR
jgi:hypothetical protein